MLLSAPLVDTFSPRDRLTESNLPTVPRLTSSLLGCA